MKNYLLKLADDSLIMGQRLAEWCGKGPYLEEDIAVINIALDQLGQANNFYNLAANLFNDGRTADDFAMLRVEKEYLNAQLVELPNGDYANTIMKAYFFAVYQNLLYENLSNSADEELRAIAQKSLKEVKYHYTHTETWMRIFAQGTEESRKRIEAAGLFDEVEEEENLVALNLIPASKQLHEEWKAKICQIWFRSSNFRIYAKRQQKRNSHRIFWIYFVRIAVHAKNLSKLCLVESWKSEVRSWKFFNMLSF